MSGPLYLALRYLAHHRLKTAILVAVIALVVYLPAGLNLLVGESATQLTARADATPLLLGQRGSPLELVLSSLYFESDVPAVAPYAEVTRVEASGLATPIPLYVRFRAQGQPIVGTTLEYFALRDLQPSQGRLMAVLGECVLGAAAAEALGAGPGDSVVSSPESVFDLAGAYPLKMKVVGVLARAHSADDRAVFVDLKTAWVIRGLGHGHQDLSGADAEAVVQAREGATAVANASLVEYNEITEANMDTFHFHGDLDTYPVTAVIAVPADAKSGVLLRGRYPEADAAQIVRPADVMEELLQTVFTVRGYVVAALAVVGGATLATAALVFWLSARLRRREIDTIAKIGGSRASVAALLSAEVVMVLLCGALLAGLLTLLTARFGDAAIRAVLLS